MSITQQLKLNTQLHCHQPKLPMDIGGQPLTCRPHHHNCTGNIGMQSERSNLKQTIPLRTGEITGTPSQDPVSFLPISQEHGHLYHRSNLDLFPSQPGSIIKTVQNTTLKFNIILVPDLSTKSISATSVILIFPRLPSSPGKVS